MCSAKTIVWDKGNVSAVRCRCCKPTATLSADVSAVKFENSESVVKSRLVHRGICINEVRAMVPKRVRDLFIFSSPQFRAKTKTKILCSYYVFHVTWFKLSVPLFLILWTFVCAPLSSWSNFCTESAFSLSGKIFFSGGHVCVFHNPQDLLHMLSQADQVLEILVWTIVGSRCFRKATISLDGNVR